ncbi:hypothetical protein H8D36_03320 [archaeon]|nr:hypothetical protein [archaeon]
MKKFEGLNVPEMKEYRLDLMFLIQVFYCDLIDRAKCDIPNCDKCLFSNDNIAQFKKWYKLQNK